MLARRARDIVSEIEDCFRDHEPSEPSGYPHTVMQRYDGNNCQRCGDNVAEDDLVAHVVRYKHAAGRLRRKALQRNETKYLYPDQRLEGHGAVLQPRPRHEIKHSG